MAVISNQTLPVGRGTTFVARWKGDARPRGWFRAVSPLFVPMLKRQEKAKMTHVREALETPAAPGERPRNSR
jgi:hypothetical protein